MLKPIIQKIKAILAVDHVTFQQTVLELYDCIFQKTQDRKHREALFMRTVYEYSRWEMPQEESSYLFSAAIDDQSQNASLSSQEVWLFIRKLKNIKAYYPDRPILASRAVFTIIEEMSEKRYSYFTMLFMSGYFPYDSDVWIANDDGERDDETKEEILAAQNLMHRACWALDKNEVLLLNYARNLLKRNKNKPLICTAILQQLMIFMKHQGMLNMQPVKYLTDDAEYDRTVWSKLRDKLKTPN